MPDDSIKIGENYYTPEQIRVIDELFGEGFLEDNPFFPDDNWDYKYRDGYRYTHQRPLLQQERQRSMAKEAEEKRQHELEQEAKQPTLLEVYATSGNYGATSNDPVVARVRGDSKNDCRKKLVQKHLNYDGDDWQAKYKEWLSMWRYERFVTDVIE